MLLAIPVALPDSGLSLLALVGIAPLCWACSRRGAGTWAIGSAVMGASWFGGALLAFWTVSPSLALVAVALWAFVVTGSFAMGGALEWRLAGRQRWFAWMAPVWCWALAVYLLDEVLYAALPLSLGLAQQAWALSPVKIVGVAGLDGLALGVGAALAHSLRIRRWQPFAAGAGSFAGLALFAAPGAYSQSSGAEVHIVQPATPHYEFSAASWSLAARGATEHRLDRLSRDAMHRKPGLVVWSEGGSAVPDLQVQRRLQTLRQLVAGSQSQLLVATQVVVNHEPNNAVGLWDANGLHAIAEKGHPVPLVELGDGGDIEVLRTRFGRAAVAVCFDAIFGSTYRTADRQGADFVVVATDDSSFGSSTMLWAHWLLARLRAAEVSLPLVFASNTGPSSISTAAGEVVARSIHGSAAVLSGTVQFRPGGPSLSALGGRHTIVVLLLCVLIWCARSPQAGGQPAPKSQSIRPRVLAAGLVLAAVASTFGAAAEVLWAWLRDGATPATFFHAAQMRISGVGVAEGLGPAFKQGGPETCGAAVLAFALMKLGEELHEEALLHDCLPKTGQVSFGDLARCAERRGYTAEGFAGDWRMLQAQETSMSILHLTGDHFVVVLNAWSDGVHLFDPAYGRVMTVDRTQLEQRWTNKLLRIGYKPAVIAGSRKSTQDTKTSWTGPQF